MKIQNIRSPIPGRKRHKLRKRSAPACQQICPRSWSQMLNSSARVDFPQSVGAMLLSARKDWCQMSRALAAAFRRYYSDRKRLPAGGRCVRGLSLRNVPHNHRFDSEWTRRFEQEELIAAGADELRLAAFGLRLPYGRAIAIRRADAVESYRPRGLDDPAITRRRIAREREDEDLILFDRELGTLDRPDARREHRRRPARRLPLRRGRCGNDQAQRKHNEEGAPEAAFRFHAFSIDTPAPKTKDRIAAALAFA